jgi:hypothetical protein
MGGLDLQAACARVDAQREERLAYAIFLTKLLGVIWSDEFKLKGDLAQVTEADVERALSGKLGPFQASFKAVLTKARGVIDGWAGGQSYVEMQRACQEADRGMDALLMGIRVLRPIAQVNKARSEKANAARHEENRDMDAELREWYARRRLEHPREKMAASARAGEKIVPLDHRTIYQKIRKY